MTIHHDKLAYGRLAKTSEELSESRIMEMVNSMSAPDGKVKREDPETNTKKRRKKRGKLTLSGDCADTVTPPDAEETDEVEESDDIAESESVAEDGGDGGDDGGDGE